GLELLVYGPYDPRGLPQLLADVHAVIVPSLVWESYSIVTREALSLGVPVIASRSGALAEAIRDGSNGILFDPGSAAELGRILRGLHDDPGRLEALRRGISASDAPDPRRRISLLVQTLEAARARGARRTDPHELAELRAIRARLSPYSQAA
ncbi:MAG TPA: glycosyltransferase, partial [Solirubrobacteraceae bacterium]|nr:glycosyltransferase [Solirubrobacteraceae bacterium]